MSLPPISTTLGLSRSVAQSRELLFDLQRQLATGKKATTYGGLGVDRAMALSLRGEMRPVKGYLDSIAQTDIRLDIMLQALGNVRAVAAATRSDGLEAGFDLVTGSQTVYQLGAAARFDEMVTLLNTKVGDRHLFGGRETEQPPVLAASHILDGVDGKAGFRQIVAERRLADLGADGLGRLVLDRQDETVTIGEDAAGSPFGFKLAAVNSSLTGTAVTGPAGAPAEIEVEFSADLPRDGETFRLALDLPDGTRTEVVLTARVGPTTKPGEFQIGGSADATAANFQTALTERVTQQANTALSAASGFAAAADFFDFDHTTPPQRVDGPPFETATALRDATDTDTVFWYRGEVSDSPARQSALVKVDDAIVAPYGARANEAAFRTIFKQLAVVAVETYVEDEPFDSHRYAAMRLRAIDALSFSGGGQTVDAIVTQITVAKTTLGQAGERHKANTAILTGVVDDVENADIYYVSAQILALQTRLEASLSVTAVLNRMSLVHYI